MKRSTIFLLLTAGALFAEEWYDDVWSDPAFEKKNVHSGNLVQSTFRNTGLVGRMPGLGEFSFEWPRGTGDEYIGDISVLVGVEYYNRLLDDPIRSVAVTKSPARGRDEVNPADPSEYWTFIPMPGFANPDTNLVAMSHQGLTWPSYWPDKGWPGSWNGYFGRDVLNADQESYFWMDDSRDMEFMDYETAYRDSIELEVWLESFPESQESAEVRRIQPFEVDTLHGGLGLKVSCRGFQWSHVLAEDVIFWLYDITNTSDINYDKVAFGMVCGTLVGGDGDSGDDLNYFDIDEEFTWTGDADDRGVAGWVPVHPGVVNVGLVGYAFLESPGNNVDWIDNDGDSKAPDTAPRLDFMTLEEMLAPRPLSEGEEVAVIDYSDPFYPRSIVRVPAPGDTLVLTWRNLEILVYDGAEVFEDPTNLVDDNFNGLIDESWAYENAAYFDWRELNLDLGLLDSLEGIVQVPWELLSEYDPLIDERRDDGVDNDGDWDPEYDDVGSDGQPVTGDVGEADGLPTPGEPHFDALDITESDQLGLTSFNEFTFPEFSSRNDEDIWSKMIPGEFDTTSLEPADVDFLYGSGYFPLRSGETQRISLAVVFGESEDDLLGNLETVRTIYNENYNYIQPPAKPLVNAEVGDGRVTLYWDDRAERSVDRISHLRDFEGYRVYRATDPGFLDAYNITDARGNAAGFNPLVQFDLINEVEGFFEIPLNGTQFYLGSNTGLVYSWTDTTAVNGQDYFYAVTSYDRGDPVAGFLPAESAKQASMDVAGNVTLDVNTVFVTPAAPAAGYQPGLVMEEAQHLSGRATGRVALEVVNEEHLRDGARYTIEILPDSSGRIADVLGWEYTAWVPDTHFVWQGNLGDWVAVVDTLVDSTATIVPGGKPGDWEWIYTETVDTSFVWDPGVGGWVAIYDSTAYDSIQVLDSEVVVPAIAWSMRRDDQEPFDESFIINTDTPRQALSHDGIFPKSFSARRLDTGDTLSIHQWLSGDTLNADGDFDMDFDAGVLTYREGFLAGIAADQVVEVRFHYDYNLVHKQLVMNLTGYATTTSLFEPVVEGVRPHFENEWQMSIDPEQSGWENAAEDILPWGLRPLALIDFSQGFRELRGTSLPNDYLQEFYPDASGSTCRAPDDFPHPDYAEIVSLLVPPVQTSYRVFDITEEQDPIELDFWIYNTSYETGPPWNRRDPLAPFDPRDVVLLYEPPERGGHDSTRVLSWMLQISAIWSDTTMTVPAGGELYRAVTRKPFAADDRYAYTVTAPDWNAQAAAGELKEVKVVPNPYLATATWERRPIRGNRGERKIQFIHLPPRATVRIFTIRGELVRTLEHDSPVWDGSLDWNLKSKEGLDVAFGVYLYHVESPAGEHKGKFALIK